MSFLLQDLNILIRTPHLHPLGKVVEEVTSQTCVAYFCLMFLMRMRREKREERRELGFQRRLETIWYSDGENMMKREVNDYSEQLLEGQKVR